jgi:hypothetical protein
VCVAVEPRRFGLPYGFAQSPLLASLALDKSELGRSLNRLHRQGVTVTVYVDDIIISHNEDDRVNEGLLDIRATAAQSNFEVNESKSVGPLEVLNAFNIQLQLGELQILAWRLEEMCGAINPKWARPFQFWHV